MLASTDSTDWQGGTTMAVDSANVYWGYLEVLIGGGPGAAPVDGAIFSVPVCGGTVTTLISDVGPVQLTVDGTSIYWTDVCSLSPLGCYIAPELGTVGRVVKMPLGGGAVTTIASGQDNPEGIVVDSTSVYWTNTTNSGVAMLLKTPLCGGSATTLAVQPAGTSTDLLAPGLLAIDDVNVYWGGPAAIYQVPKGGGAPVTLAVAPPYDYDIAVDGKNVYWDLQTWPAGPASLMKCAIGGCGGTPTTLASSPSPNFLGMALNATTMYWVNLSILSVPLDGGAVTTIAAPTNDPEQPGYAQVVAADATSVYWVQTTPAQVMRFTPK